MLRAPGGLMADSVHPQRLSRVCAFRSQPRCTVQSRQRSFVSQCRKGGDKKSSSEVASHVSSHVLSRHQQSHTSCQEQVVQTLTGLCSSHRNRQADSIISRQTAAAVLAHQTSHLRQLALEAVGKLEVDTPDRDRQQRAASS
eukprot:2364059-Rhodomonas_salina.3